MTGLPGLVIVVGRPVTVTVLPRPATVETRVEVMVLVITPPGRVIVDVLVTVFPRPVIETVVGLPVTVTVLPRPVRVTVVARHGIVDT